MASYSHAWQLQKNVNETSDGKVNSYLSEFQRQVARLNCLDSGQRGRTSDVATLYKELETILDALNGLDYHSQFLNERVVGRVLSQFCSLISVDNSHVVNKFCLFLQNTLNKQTLVLVHNANTVVEFLISALRQYYPGQGSGSSPRSLSNVLRALATVLYENGSRTKQFHESLVGGSASSSGLLVKLAETSDIDILRSVVQCLENITLRVVGESEYLNAEHQESCMRCLLKALQCLPTLSPSPSNASTDDVIRCKILTSALKGQQNVISVCKAVPTDLVGPILAVIHVYMVYGLPGAPNVITNSLYSVPLSQYVQAENSTANKISNSSSSKDDVMPSGNAEKPKTSAKKKNKSKHGKDSKSVTDASTESNANEEGISWDVGGEGGFFGALISSDSECSDMEGVGGTTAGARVNLTSRSKVRINALGCFHALIKAVEKRVIFGYWSSFIPDTPADGGSLSSKRTLFTVVMKDPSHKIRCAGLSVLTALLDGSKQYLQAAEDSDQYRNAPFTPFSVTLGHMIREMHRCLLLLLAADNTAIFITQTIKCLSMLIGSVPYQRLRPGLLSRAVKQVRQYLAHRDPNVRVACLTCLGRVVSVQAPLLEVLQIVQPSRPNHRTSELSQSSTGWPTPLRSFKEPDVPESASAAPAGCELVPGSSPRSPLVSTTPSSTPVWRSGSHTPTSTHPFDNSLSGERGYGAEEISWLVRLCVRNVAPHFIDRFHTEASVSSRRGPEMMEDTTIASLSSQPLPVRLESLQVLALLSRSYFTIVKPHIRLMRELIQFCLADPDTTVRLHGAKFLQVVGSMLLQHLQQLSEPRTAQSDDETLLQAVDMWRHLLSGAGSIQSLICSDSGLPDVTIRTTLCDSLATVGPTIVYDQLPNNDTSECLRQLMHISQQRSTDHKVRVAAINALGCYVVYKCLRKDAVVVADIANTLLTTATKDVESNVNVRWKASWSLSSLADALLLNRSEDDATFIESFSDLLLLKLFTTAVRLCSENDKIHCNAVRAVGTLLSYLPQKSYDSGKFKDMIDSSIRAVITSITSTGCMKVRWNACYAVGNILRNEVLAASVTYHLRDLFGAVTTVMQTCSNYKVRISAVSCLFVLQDRGHYGDTTLYVSLWDSLVSVMTATDDYAEYTEYKNRVSLTDQICRTLIHLTRLLSWNDLEALHALLMDKVQVLVDVLVEFRQLSDNEISPEHNERLELLAKATSHLKELEAKADLSSVQHSALLLLLNIYSRTDSTSSDIVSDIDAMSSHMTSLASGFRQSYD